MMLYLSRMSYYELWSATTRNLATGGSLKHTFQKEPPWIVDGEG
jgi:hypothetical protein